MLIRLCFLAALFSTFALAMDLPIFNYQPRDSLDSILDGLWEEPMDLVLPEQNYGPIEVPAIPRARIIHPLPPEWKCQSQETEASLCLMSDADGQKDPSPTKQTMKTKVQEEEKSKKKEEVERAEIQPVDFCTKTKFSLQKSRTPILDALIYACLLPHSGIYRVDGVILFDDIDEGLKTIEGLSPKSSECKVYKPARIKTLERWFDLSGYTGAVTMRLKEEKYEKFQARWLELKTSIPANALIQK